MGSQRLKPISLVNSQTKEKVKEKERANRRALLCLTRRVQEEKEKERVRTNPNPNLQRIQVLTKAGPSVPPVPKQGGSKSSTDGQKKRPRKCVYYASPSGCIRGKDCLYLHQNDKVTKKPLPADPANVQNMQGRPQAIPKSSATSALLSLRQIGRDWSAFWEKLTGENPKFRAVALVTWMVRHLLILLNCSIQETLRHKRESWQRVQPMMWRLTRLSISRDLLYKNSWDQKLILSYC